MSLNNFDTLLAFALIMLLLSMVVTAIVQMAVAVLGLRSSNLKLALTQLLQQSSGLLKDHAETIADKVVTHPALAHGFLFGLIKRPITAITQEELRRVLLDLSKGPQGDQAVDALRQALGMDSQVLPKPYQSITDVVKKELPEAEATLQVALRELSDKASNLERGMAEWFDSVMVRSTDWFTAKTRVVTVVAALGLALVGGVDSISLIRQIHSNDTLRSALVANSEAIRTNTEQTYQRLKDAPNNASTVDALNGIKLELATVDKTLADTDLKVFVGFKNATLMGMLLTAAFLSLGAPFWFNALRQLAALRPMIAGVAQSAAAEEAEGGNAAPAAKATTTGR